MKARSDVTTTLVAERRLAAGGMAEVLLARLLGTSGFGRRVVVKRILASHRDDDPSPPAWRFR